MSGVDMHLFLFKFSASNSYMIDLILSVSRFICTRLVDAMLAVIVWCTYQCTCSE